MKHNSRKPLLVALLIVAGILLAAFVRFRPMLRTYAGPDTAVLLIPDCATESQIADSLASATGDPAFAAGVLRAWKFFHGTPESANGRYAISPGMPAYMLAHLMHTGRQTPVRLTFNNIRTLRQLAERVGARMEFTADDFLAACDSVLPALGFQSREQYPAAFIPDTYEFYWNAGSEQVVERLASVRSNYWNEERRQHARALGLNPVGVATIASIVEEETVAADERPQVARLYLNRLAKGMKLQADPTVKFAVGDFSLRRITGTHLRVASPFNTYLHEGLPPGPIRIPERSTLEAVLNAPAHDYIYMCARPDFSGRHNFAKDFSTHELNAAAYRKALDARGIK
ncbi:MAG: endolytic transglycosylase MltG [Muribaculaceae bacterium]|nr:endolytic transglycosylase MltG [Muribaculaceae bacterium]